MKIVPAGGSSSLRRRFRRVDLPAPVRPTMATVVAGRDAERDVREDRPLAVREREPPEFHVARRGVRRVSASAALRHGVPDVHHAVPRRGPALPEVHDPAERDRRPDQLDHVEVELHVPRDRELPREDEASARPRASARNRRRRGTGGAGRTARSGARGRGSAS